MASFTTRVELLKATWQHYENLHVAMGRSGFSRTIVGDNGVRYNMLPAEYDLVANLDMNVVLEIAKAAAASTGLGYRVFVSEAPKRMWFNLELAG